jgi:peptidoglycan glycosyltransferase
MFELLTNFLNAMPEEDVFRILKLTFLVFFGIVALVILFAPSPSPGKMTYRMLRTAIVLLFLAVLVYQMTWQIGGYSRRDFLRFVHRYDKRPNAATRQIMRGPIFDCRGLVIAAPRAGDMWGRRYPFGNAFAHPVGYYHPRCGITGVELLYDSVLNGYLQKDDPIEKAKDLFRGRAEEGQSVTLTIDSRLQETAFDLLKGRRGAVIVMRPVSGAILAMASSPGFNPHDPGPASIEENMPTFNRATQGRYPPGSLFKILIASTALSEKRSPSFACPGMGYIAAASTPPIRDSEYYSCERRGEVWPGWGNLNMREAMVHSSNVYFAQLGVACGPDAFNSMVKRMHINEPLIYMKSLDDALKTSPGNAPVVEHRSKLAMLSIGQGEILMTPLHVACMTATIANDGDFMAPRLDITEPVKKLETLCASHVAVQVRSMLRQVVISGTGKGCNLPGLEVCGKTGTAQVPGAEDHAWFTCMAPQKNPNIVVTVLIENGGFGSAAALPVAKEMLLAADRLGYVRKPEVFKIMKSMPPVQGRAK